MPAPKLSCEQVAEAIPTAGNVKFIDAGGQKSVFAADIGSGRYVLKFLTPNPQRLAGLNSDTSLDMAPDDVTARARREVETMAQCNSPHLVRPGPLPLQQVQIADQELLVFSEELIDGETLDKHHDRVRNWPVEDVVRLGLEMAHALDALWCFQKIHRDVKPNNIMRCTSDGRFVLLDMGFVFDLNDESYSVCPVGTMVFFSPEQTDFANRRSVLDFRSDLFSLGIVMYMMLVGKHPFATNARTSWDVINNILRSAPIPPITLRTDVPSALNQIVMRLLKKRPNLRYRRIDMFVDALRSVPQGGN